MPFFHHVPHLDPFCPTPISHPHQYRRRLLPLAAGLEQAVAHGARELPAPIALAIQQYPPHQYGVNSLPGSPVSTSFPQRPAFRRALTSTAASSVSSEQSRFDDLHYSQTHFSRSTLLVYPDSEATLQPSGEEQEGDIRELLASSDEESSLPPSTPGFETTKIPPRGSSVSLTTKQSMESDKSVYSESIVLAPAPKKSQDKLSGLVSIPCHHFGRRDCN